MEFKLDHSETTQFVNLELRNIMDEMQMPPPASKEENQPHSPERDGRSHKVAKQDGTRTWHDARVSIGIEYDTGRYCTCGEWVTP